MKNDKRQMTSDNQRILVCPLDWGLGHATRCIPLIYAFLQQGHDVVLAGSGPSFRLLQQEFPHLTAVHFESFTLRYSSGKSQVWAVLKSFPRLINRTIQENKQLKTIVKQYDITQVLSDNRFGCYHRLVRSIYLTHQVFIKLPSSFRFLEPLVAWLHRKVMDCYDECWIPDYPSMKESLSGELSHKKTLPRHAKFIGPLSRFHGSVDKITKDSLTVAVVSGVEPQRSLFEQQLLDSLQSVQSEEVILVQGIPGQDVKPYMRGKVKVFATMPSDDLKQLLLRAEHIICRSGYSSIMDLHALGKLSAATFVPTPGQSEQEYLALYLNAKNLGENRK